MPVREIAIAALGNAWRYNIRNGLLDTDPKLICINSANYSTNTDAIKECVNDFTLIEMDSVNHYPMIEAPEAFNRILADVLNLDPESL